MCGRGRSFSKGAVRLTGRLGSRPTLMSVFQFNLGSLYTIYQMKNTSKLINMYILHYFALDTRKIFKNIPCLREN